MADGQTITGCLAEAEISRIGSPLTVACGNQIADDTAHISLLGGVIVGSGMVTRDGHRPCVVTVMKAFEEFCGIGDVLCRVEHFGNGVEFRTVKIDVDLHAADIDQLGAVASGIIHQLVGLWKIFGKIGLAFDVDGKGTERTLTSCFRQSH